MMERSNYVQQEVQQEQLQQQLLLYQELKYRFPGASQMVVLGTMQRNANHRERCLDELTLLCMGMGGGTTYQQQQQSAHLPHHLQPSQTSSQQAYGAQQTRVPPGSRSHSVSGVPGGDGSKRPYGFRYTAEDVGGPQTAPVMSSDHDVSPFVPVYQFRPPPMQHSTSYGSGLSQQLQSPPKPPKPPVPPPTYRGHLEQKEQQQQQRYQYAPRDQSAMTMSRYPGGIGGFPRNVTSPPTVTHRTSFNLTPVYPNLRGFYEEWVPTQQQQQQQQKQTEQQYGWNTGRNISPSLAGVESHQLLQITTPGHSAQQHHQQPYHQSRLHISISPNGNSVSSVTPPNRRTSTDSNHSTPPTGPPKFQFQQRDNSYGGGIESLLTRECPFDVNDPEQESLSHKPLRPLPSPTLGVQRSASGTSSTSSTLSSSAAPSWPSPTPISQYLRNPAVMVNDDDKAFTQALIVHQKERLGLLQRELFRESQGLQEALGDVTNMEHQLYRCRTQFHDQVFPTFDDIQRLWSEIRSYSVDCECMIHVFDHLHKGQVPLGETNEDFYKSINTGQQGQVLPPMPIARQVGSDKGNIVPTSVSTSTTPSSVPNDHVDNCPHADAEEIDDEERDKWSCSACTFLNNHALDRCEMCEMPRVVLGGMHNLRIHVRQSPACAIVSNKGVQLKLTHRLGPVKRCDDDQIF